MYVCVCFFQILVAALKFFLGREQDEEDKSDDEDDVSISILHSFF
jgi:hypothetical protein